MQRLVARGVTVPPASRGVLVTTALRRLADGYPGVPYDGDVVYLRSTNGDAGSLDAWRRLVRGELRVVDLEAGHHDLMREPSVARVATILRAEIDGVRLSGTRPASAP